MRTILFFLLFVSHAALAQNFAVVQYTNSPDGIPNGWPETIRPLGTNAGPLVGQEVLMTSAQLSNVMTVLSPAKDAWNRLIESRPRALRSVNSELTRRLQGTNWDDPAYRALALICQDMALIHEIIVRANLQTNLTVPKRTRANALSNELATIYGYWSAANALRKKISTNATPVEPETDQSWPATPLGE